MTPLWAFLGAVAAPLLGGGAVGRVVFAVACVVIMVLTVLVVVVLLGARLGPVGTAVAWLGTLLRAFFGGVWRLIVFVALLVRAAVEWASRRTGPLAAGALGFVAGVLAVALVLQGGPLVRIGLGWVLSSPCGQPLELRVLTSAENVAALQAAGRRYADESADLRGCPRVRFSVTPQPPLATMSQAANKEWNDPASWNSSTYRALIAVHPDIWIPSSAATEEYLRQAFANLGQVTFDRMSPVATSALLVAFTPALEARLGTQPSPTDLAGLRAWLESVGAPLVRPRADLSEIGLIASAGLYGASKDASKDSSKDIADEIAYTPPNLPLSDAASLLCYARDRFDTVKESLAMIVPEHLVYAVNNHQDLGACAPGRQTAGLSWHRLDGLPTLSYRYVRLKWADQWNDARERAAIDFHDWLAQDRLAPYGYRDSAGVSDRKEPMPLGRELDSGRADSVEPATVEPARLIDRLGKAHPETSFLLLVDASGSMGSPITGGTALQRASSGASTLLRRLRDGRDRVRLATFSDSGGLGETLATGPAQVAGRLGTLAVHGRDAPLGDVLAQAAPLLADTPNPVVVMLTDGAHEAGDLGRTVAALRKVKGLRVRLLLTGEQRCDADHIERLVKAAGEAVKCAPISRAEAATPYQDQVDEVDKELTELWRESP
ncbi:VWA domain-containing protein [Nonomuraea aurantiaca]|uniref:VWA domain-containing protein n=1 Tax=Nonomuraea aurantiaca TaxID=2878562 RepID=UPI001CD9E4A8|nr:VWA domain-containing protein [Nonomuraea aurantiaca]